MLNNVSIVGRWVSDIEAPKTVGSTVKAEGRVAVDNPFKKDATDFFTVEMWGKTAEIAAQYCKKGQVAILNGRLSQETWEKDGQKREKVIIVADRIALPPKSGGPDASDAGAKPAPKAKPAKVEEDPEELF